MSNFDQYAKKYAAKIFDAFKSTLDVYFISPKITFKCIFKFCTFTTHMDV